MIPLFRRTLSLYQHFEHICLHAWFTLLPINDKFSVEILNFSTFLARCH